MKQAPKNQAGSYIVIAELPQVQQRALKAWLLGPGLGKTQPVMEQEGDRAMDCLWNWDYCRWYAFGSVPSAAD